MSKHTPGPWKLGFSQGSFADVDGLNWWGLARVVVKIRGKRNEEGEANARLISAAPELLRVAQMIVGDYHEDTVHAAALAAIAKATGDA